MQAGHDASPFPAPRVRADTSLAAASAALAAAVLYLPIVLGLARQWLEDGDAAYGIVVAAAAALAFRTRVPQLRSLEPRGSCWAVLPLLAACALYVVGTLSADLFLLRTSLPAFAASATWFIWGMRHVRALAAPFALLFVAIPLPGAVITEVTMPLQLLASRLAAALLEVAGYTVARDGNVLALEFITLEVAQACSGMRSLVTLLALVSVYAATSGVSPRRFAALAAATVPIALAGNAMRVAFTGMLASYLGEAAARGPVHEATGWAAFVLMGGALIGVSAAAARIGTARLSSRGMVT